MGNQHALHGPGSSFASHLNNHDGSSATDDHVLLVEQPPRSHLLNLTWTQQWDAVLRRCQSNPEEARHVNNSRRTALHLATFAFDSVPANAVVSLLGANQGAVVRGDSIRWTPLHYACQFGCRVDVLTVLLCSAVSVARGWLGGGGGDTNEDLRRHILGDGNCTGCINEGEGEGGQGRSRSVDSPLFLACNRNADFRTLYVLLYYAYAYPKELGWWVAPCTGAERWYDDGTAQGGGVNDDDDDGQRQDGGVLGEAALTPLEVLWSKLPSDQACPAVNEMKESGDSCPYSCCASSTKDQRGTFSFFWDNMFLLLLSSGDARQQCFEYARDRDPGGICALQLFNCLRAAHTWYLLHHICALRVPIPGLAKVGMTLYPDDVRKQDSDGGNLPLHHIIMSSRADRRTVGWSQDDSPGKKRESIVNKLLGEFPDGARVPNLEGKFPLTLAVESRMAWSDCIENIVSAAPGVLYSRDTTTHLHPFMLAAVDTVGGSLETVYSLLRACPELVSVTRPSC